MYDDETLLDQFEYVSDNCSYSGTHDWYGKFLCLHVPNDSQRKSGFLGKFIHFSYAKVYCIL